MAIFPKDVVLAVKSELQGASVLSYVDLVVISKYNPRDIPDFSAYAILISPMTAKSDFYAANQRWIGNAVELVLLAKINDRSEEDAIVADLPGDAPPNVGILTMYENVYSTLYGNTLGGEIELLPHLDELDVQSTFNLLTDDRDTFIMEGRMVYQPRGKRWVGSP